MLPKVPNRDGGGIDRQSRALLVNDVTVYYGLPGSPALDGVRLDAELGEMVLLIGPNGGGKTTLLRSIAGLLRPSKGSLSIFGKDPFKDLAIRRVVGYVPQIKELNIHAPLTVMDLVSFGRYPFVRPLKRMGSREEEKILEFLRAVKLEEESSKRISELSGGQLSRAIIARALAQEPMIYLLDEPFESIDRSTERLILDVLREEKERGKLVIVAEHHLSEISYFDRAILIDKRIIIDGEPAEVITEYNKRCGFR